MKLNALLMLIINNENIEHFGSWHLQKCGKLYLYVGTFFANYSKLLYEDLTQSTLRSTIGQWKCHTTR